MLLLECLTAVNVETNVFSILHRVIHYNFVRSSIKHNYISLLNSDIFPLGNLSLVQGINIFWTVSLNQKRIILLKTIRRC